MLLPAPQHWQVNLVGSTHGDRQEGPDPHPGPLGLGDLFFFFFFLRAVLERMVKKRESATSVQRTILTDVVSIIARLCFVIQVPFTYLNCLL